LTAFNPQDVGWNAAARIRRLNNLDASLLSRLDLTGGTRPV
jgi:hypothetical protein